MPGYSNSYKSKKGGSSMTKKRKSYGKKSMPKKKK